MKSLKTVMLALVLICGFGLSAAHAENADEGSSKMPGAQKRHEGVGKKFQEVYSQLNLSDDQKKQLQNNRQQNKDKRKAMFEKMRATKEAFDQELMKPDLDMNKINEIQLQFKASQSQMIDDRLNSILEVRKIMTPEQFSKFISLMKKHKHEEGHEESHEEEGK